MNTNDYKQPEPKGDPAPKQKVRLVPNREHPAFALANFMQNIRHSLAKESNDVLERLIDAAFERQQVDPKISVKDAVGVTYGPRKRKIDFLCECAKRVFLNEWTERTNTDYYELRERWLAEGKRSPEQRLQAKYNKLNPIKI